MVATHSDSASRISRVVDRDGLRHAFDQVAALDFHGQRLVQRIGRADLYLHRSAVRSPISRLYLRFRYCMMASSISLPATRTERE